MGETMGGRTVLPSVGTPIMDAVEKVADLVKSRRITNDEAGAFLQRIVWGPFVELVVKLTPTPLDDVALTMIRALLPKKV